MQDYPNFIAVPDVFFCGTDNLVLAPDTRIRMIKIYEGLISSICCEVIGNHVTLQWYYLWGAQSRPISYLVSVATTKLNQILSELTESEEGSSSSQIS